MTSPSFDLDGRVAVVTGGYGVLGGSIASGLAAAKAKVAILGRRRDVAEAHAQEIRRNGGEAMVLVADALDEVQVRTARDDLLRAWGRIDILINAAGGNVARARNDTKSIFEVPLDAFEEALRLNLHGTVIPTLAFAESMAQRKAGCIVNISSMAAMRAISGVLAYSIAKTGIDSFTRWMAVELARKHGDGLRVNAIAPGFFVSEQNRAVLINPDGSYT
jgi:NAD(P)-dependent dehydrogenase (short-subunit alcohol dehydrogenase family)